MAETSNPQGGQQQVQIRVDESRMNTTYSNTIRTTTTADEVVLDFGLNLPAQGPQGQHAMIFAVGSRIVLNWSGAKRLISSLSQVVRAYEDQFGTIELDQPRAASASH
ncbi:MAG: DUF3467 domain-containing protein [Phycisphaeraceae bacterium]|nr:DUF3467 domain-containing protein [Phycisphaeraceae bacterium]